MKRHGYNTVTAAVALYCRTIEHCAVEEKKSWSESRSCHFDVEIYTMIFSARSFTVILSSMIDEH